MNDDKKIAFLVGEGTITIEEAREWAKEMGWTEPWSPEISLDRPVMVALVDSVGLRT